METIIDWKPSQLPVDTVIFVPADPDYAGYWIKEEGGIWARIKTWQDDILDVREADLHFTYFEITAVPASWYEEFRAIAPRNPYSLNRAGWVMYGEKLTLGQEKLHLANTVKTVAEMVKRTFA